jgi:hypothetical protein
MNRGPVDLAVVSTISDTFEEIERFLTALLFSITTNDQQSRQHHQNFLMTSKQLDPTPSRYFGPQHFTLPGFSI